MSTFITPTQQKPQNHLIPTFFLLFTYRYIAVANVSEQNKTHTLNKNVLTNMPTALTESKCLIALLDEWANYLFAIKVLILLSIINQN